MAQTQATPKWRRLMLHLVTTLFGPEKALKWVDVQPSERAALALRRNSVVFGRAKEVVFIIPLVGRQHVSNWSVIEQRLKATVQSFHQQSNPNWRCIICSQDRPNSITFDAQVQFSPFAAEIDGNDKWPKLEHLVRSLPDARVTTAYVMPFDADDLLHPGAVDEMLTRDMPGGYLVSEGYIRDMAADRVARAAPPSFAFPLRKPFWKLCGSCAAFRYDGSAQATKFLAGLVAHEHRMFPYLASLTGRPLSNLSLPGALYMLNHGENFGARRGRVGFKPRFVERFKVTEPAEMASVTRDFPAAF